MELWEKLMAQEERKAVDAQVEKDWAKKRGLVLTKIQTHIDTISNFSGAIAREQEETLEIMTRLYKAARRVVTDTGY